MSYRNPPPPRDRSPPRQFDRRTSNTYTPPGTSSSYRPPIESAPPPIDRAPPRGPRAESFRGRDSSFNVGPRGRGGAFGPRGGDSWDRDRDRDRDRDLRTTPSTFSRDEDRSGWPRRDDRPPPFIRDRTYVGRDVGRDRSASPTRQRRGSKESIGPTFSRPNEAGPGYFGGGVRGSSIRGGRGRGSEWDRPRGRSSFIGDRGERDLFPPRSRSRDGWREQQHFDRGRTFGPEPDRTDRFERREFDRPIDRETRPREHDVWQRDVSPARSSAGNRAGSPGALSSISQDRPQRPDYEGPRRPLPMSSALSTRDTRRDLEADYFTTRNETPRREPTFPQPPPVQQIPQSSAFGLDYGPPPSAPTAAPTQPTPTGEKNSQALKSNKPEPTSSANSVFQPPSGPKAERSREASFNAPSVQASVQHSDFGAGKPDNPSRQQRQLLPEVAQRLEAPRPGNENVSDRGLPPFLHADRPLPPNVPLGPRMSSGPAFKLKTSPVVQQTDLPSQNKPTGLDARIFTNAPTGPRSTSILPPSGPRSTLPSGPAGPQTGSAPSQWRRPNIEYRNPKPSIMNQMSNRPHMLDRSPLPPAPVTSKQSPRPGIAHPTQRNGKSPIAGSRSTVLSPVLAKVEAKPQADTETSAPVSEEEDVDDSPEEDDGLDEDYFAHSEKTHIREMELLKSKKPPALLEDPTVVNLLIRIQLLDMIAESAVPACIHAAKQEKDVEMADQPVEGLLSPKITPEHSEKSHSPKIEHPRPRGRPLKEPLMNPIPTPPIDELPHLPKHLLYFPLAGKILFDELAEDEVEEEEMTMLIRQDLEHIAWDEQGDLLELYDFYRQKYPEWKYEIDRLERMRRELEATPDPGSPGGQSSVSIPPSAERLTGRAARNATEFDIEKAILMSQQSAREEEERREREAASNAVPNYEQEAVVASMLKPSDREPYWRFQDKNTFIPPSLAVDLMEYIPPEDDFTEEEQLKFIAAFCQTPKKWGIIADQISGRSYQQCITHYYLTKNEAHYKEHWRRSQPKRKRGRAATKPRSTALLSDMALNEDPDSTPVPVTDSGRPRRAAAPTFGDLPDGEVATAIPATKRLAVGLKEGSEDPAPKPAKGRKAGTATKVRRTKAQILADKQAAALQNNPDGSLMKPASGRNRTILRAENPVARTDAPAIATVLRPADTDQIVNMQMPGSTSAIAQQSPQVPVVTSYWSVPEQQKFRQLIAYYGHSYQKIADFMKTKSQAMIKNHYAREITKGDRELEQLANNAEERIARGESLGRLPSPIAPVKRKYDSTPSMPTQSRPSTATADPAVSESDRTALSAKVGLVEDFPANAIHRDTTGSIVAKPSPRNDPLQQNSPRHLPVQPKIEDFTRDRPLFPQRVMQGPQRSHLLDDSGSFHLGGRQQPIAGEHVLHHHPPQVVELRGGEAPSSQPQAHPRDLLGQARESLAHGQPSAQTSQFASMNSPRPSSSSRHPHSRNHSLSAPGPSAFNEAAADLIGLRNVEARRFNYGTATTHSPRAQPLQASVAPRSEPYAAFASQPPPKPEPPKLAKRSNVFDLLSNDDPPERPLKRSSTDSAHRSSIQTPPLQPVAVNPIVPQPIFPQRPREDLQGRHHSSLYGPVSSTRNPIAELRGQYTSSPAPPHRSESWLDKFDPRQSSGADRASNQSPLYPGIPPAPSSASKSAMQGLGDNVMLSESNGSQRPEFDRSQISSPVRQTTTPMPQYRSASAAPQHSRMSSLGYGQSIQLNQDQRQPPAQQQQHIQSSLGNSASANNTPGPGLHHRAQPSIDYAPHRLTIQQHLAQSGPERGRDVPDAFDPRHHREDALPRSSQDAGHRPIAPPPEPRSTMQEQSRQEPRDMYRSDPTQVPPPPGRTSQPPMSQLNPAFGGPNHRSYTPPIGQFNDTRDPRDPRDSRDPRQMAGMHNQHAHHHHQSLAAQQPQDPRQQQPQSQGPPQQQMHHHHHHHHHHAPPHHQQHQHGQPSIGQMPQHQNIAPHSHQSQQQQQQPQHMQSQQGQNGPPPSQHQQGPPQHQHYQPRFGPQGLAPPPQPGGHYRGYSQSADERR